MVDCLPLFDGNHWQNTAPSPMITTPFMPLIYIVNLPVAQWVPTDDRSSPTYRLAADEKVE